MCLEHSFAISLLVNGANQQSPACRRASDLSYITMTICHHRIMPQIRQRLSTAAGHLQEKLDALDAEQPVVDKTTSTSSMTWRGITYQVRNQRIRANLQQVAELSQQQQDRMQTNQMSHEAGQFDALIGALNETKSNLGSSLKTTPGVPLVTQVPSKCFTCTGCKRTVTLAAWSPRHNRQWHVQSYASNCTWL